MTLESLHIIQINVGLQTRHFQLKIQT